MANHHDEFEDDDLISKSEIKRQMHALQELGRGLTELNPKQLATIPASEELLEAIADHKRLKHNEAKRRMMQRIGKLMREEDSDAIREAWELTQPGSAGAVRADKQLESWRARLVDRGDAAIAQFIDEYPQTDRQQLRTLTRNAQRDAKKTPEKPYATNAGKKLFQFIRSVVKG